MAYDNRYQNYPPRGSGRGGVAGSGKPATVTMWMSDKRMATMNVYDGRDGRRVATITLCENKIMPESAGELGTVRNFGEVAMRDTLSLDDALAACRNWLEGKSLASSGF